MKGQPTERRRPERRRTAFTEEERGRISERLNQNIGKEHLSTRTGNGNTRITYIEGWVVIDQANRVFGFDGWSSEIYGMKREYRDISKDGRISIGYSCYCRVTLKDGTQREDIGYGGSEGHAQHHASIDKAKKGAATDALKRALRQFGNWLGNCCYNKAYLRELPQQAAAASERRLPPIINQPAPQQPVRPPRAVDGAANGATGNDAKIERTAEAVIVASFDDNSFDLSMSETDGL